MMIRETTFSPRSLAALMWVVGVIIMLPSECRAQLPEIRESSGFPPEVRKIYSKGADYLAKIQAEDGSWNSGANMHGNAATGIAGLSVMAFLSTGEDPNFGKYSNNIRKALRFIIRKQNPKTGYIPDSMYTHGFAMLALAEAYGAVDDELLWAGQPKNERSRTIAQALELAVRLAVDSQKDNVVKGWRYSPSDKSSADTSIVGAVLMGLLAARNAGIKVPDNSIDQALNYMKSMTSDGGGNVGYSGGMGGLGNSDARSAIACLVYSIGKRKKWKEYGATQKYCVDNLMNDETNSFSPHYTRYYKAQALFQADYEAWQKWNRKTIRTIRTTQSEDGRIGKSEHGPAYSTAMSLLALALNYKFLPIYER